MSTAHTADELDALPEGTVARPVQSGYDRGPVILRTAEGWSMAGDPKPWVAGAERGRLDSGALVEVFGSWRVIDGPVSTWPVIAVWNPKTQTLDRPVGLPSDPNTHAGRLERWLADARADSARLHGALEWLVNLKDGARDEAYDSAKAAAWARAREVLGR